MPGHLIVALTFLGLALWSSSALPQQASSIPSYAQYDGFIRTADASCEEDRWPLRAVVSDGKIFIGDGSGNIAPDGSFDFKYPRGADEFRFFGTVEQKRVAGTFELLPFSNCMFDFEARR